MTYQPVDLVEFERNFEHYLDRVERGERFILTENGEPKLYVIPATEYEELTRADAPADTTGAPR